MMTCEKYQADKNARPDSHRLINNSKFPNTSAQKSKGIYMLDTNSMIILIIQESSFRALFGLYLISSSLSL